MSWEAHTCPICNATVPVSLPHNCNDFMTPPTVPNRWAAFTDDELQILDGWHWRRSPEGDGAYARESMRLHSELTAELERRAESTKGDR